ncbi:hypothetical protein [Bradyrhizobium sp. Bra78]|uniref:hypothetical protein n=1 Tax=Bradyrhizobium sp. Bra78 TaxID=2926010 RepID=UPI0021C9137B|nr:hypothetical protein [Bradyrhizobium sp. Bra78]
MSNGDGITVQSSIGSGRFKTSLARSARKRRRSYEQARANDGRREIYTKLESLSLKAAELIGSRRWSIPAGRLQSE